LSASQQFGAKRHFFAWKRSAFLDSRPSHVQLGLEVGDRGGQLRKLRLRAQCGEVEVVHALADTEQGNAQAGARLRELRVFQGAAWSERWVVDRLLRGNVRVVGIVRRNRHRLPTRQRDGYCRDA